MGIEGGEEVGGNGAGDAGRSRETSRAAMAHTSGYCRQLRLYAKAHLLCHIFEVSAKQPDTHAINNRPPLFLPFPTRSSGYADMHLQALPIELLLSGERPLAEALIHLCEAACDAPQHGAQRDADAEGHALREVLDSTL
jgi:hypothetical protein